MKGRKHVLCLAGLLLSFTISAGAAFLDTPPLSPLDSGAIPVETVAQILREDTLDEDYPSNTVSINEVDAVLALMGTPEAALAGQGYTDQEITLIKDGTLVEWLKNAIFARAGCSDETLAACGYEAEEVQVLRGLTGRETLEELRSTAANLTCRSRLVFCRYDANQNMTHLAVAFEWAWDRQPALTMGEERILLTWDDNEMTLGNELLASWNFHYVSYRSEEGMSRTRTPLRETSFTCAEAIFPAEEEDGWAESGRGTVSLCAVGEKKTLACSLQYGHTVLALRPLEEQTLPELLLQGVKLGIRAVGFYLRS